MSNELETQIDDDLLRDKVLNFFKKNKIKVFLLMFLLIILPISLQVFLFYKDKTQEQFISRYIEAEILINNNDKRGIQILNTIKLLAISKLTEYYINNNQKDKALRILNDAKGFDNKMFEELSEIKKVILYFDTIKENEILNISKDNKSNFKLIKTKLLYDYYLKSNQLEKAKQVQKNFK